MTRIAFDVQVAKGTLKEGYTYYPEAAPCLDCIDNKNSPGRGVIANNGRCAFCGSKPKNLPGPGLTGEYEHAFPRAWVMRDDHGWWIERESKDGITRKHATAPFDVVAIVNIPGDKLFHIEHAGDSHTGNMAECRQWLDRRGAFHDHRSAKDVLAIIATNCAAHEDGQTAFYFTEDDGRLVEPKGIYPRQDHERDVWDRIAPHLDHEPTPDEWLTLHQFCAMLQPREWGPLLGITAIAPLTPILRGYGRQVPHIYLVSTESGTGKSPTLYALVERAWGAPVRDASDVKSEYGFLRAASASAAPLAVDEVESLDWDRFGPLLKSLSGSLGNVRRTDWGRGDLVFQALAPFAFAANAIPSRPEQEMARVMVSPFDEARKRTWARTDWDQFSGLVSSMPPFGPASARAMLDLFPTWPELKTALDAAMHEIEDARGEPFSSAKRAEMWSGVWLGLAAVAHASDGIVERLSLERFISEVVNPVEDYTDSLHEDPVTKFQEFLVSYIAKGNRRDVDYGWTNNEDGKNFMQVHEGQGDPKAPWPHDGYLVKGPLLEAYNKTVHVQAMRFANLRQLQEAINRSHGYPGGFKLDRRGLKPSRVNGKQWRAAFVPDEGAGKNEETRVTVSQDVLNRGETP